MKKNVLDMSGTMADADVSFDLNMRGVCVYVHVPSHCVDRIQSTCRGSVYSESEEERSVLRDLSQAVMLPFSPFTPRYSLCAKSRPDTLYL